MSKFYSAEDCRRKATQHQEMSSMAYADRDPTDGKRHMELSKVWDQRSTDGGYQS